MANSEGRFAVLFTEGVSSSAEGELAIDETTSTVSLAPNVCVVPGVLRLWKKTRSVFEKLRVLLLSRKVLRVILKEREMTMIVLSII